MPRAKSSTTSKVSATDIVTEVDTLDTVEAVEVSDPTEVSTTRLNTDNITPVPPTTIEELVDQVIMGVRGYGAKFNNDKTLSVVDLASKGAQQGVTYRQLHVQADQGYISIALRETFKSTHGGQEQTKTLSKVSVPVYETKAYSKLQSRFFGYSTTKNVNEGVALLDILRKTVS
jgi:hypothetical protein|tara:strand:- start:182 stop:703 length:522 start_codon:yes stop_codon:yes gene_type:complete